MARLAPAPGSGSRWESVDGDPRIVVGSTVLLGSRDDRYGSLLGCRARVNSIGITNEGYTLFTTISALGHFWRRRDCVLIDEEKQRALEALHNCGYRSFLNMPDKGSAAPLASKIGKENLEWLADAKIISRDTECVIDYERLARALGESTSVELVEGEPTERRVMKLLQGVQRFNEGSEVERVVGVSNLEWLVVSGILDKNIAFMADSCPVYYIVNHTRLQQALGEWEPLDEYREFLRRASKGGVSRHGYDISQKTLERLIGNGIVLSHTEYWCDTNMAAARRELGEPEYQVGDLVLGGHHDWAGRIVTAIEGQRLVCRDKSGREFETSSPIHVSDALNYSATLELPVEKELALLRALLKDNTLKRAAQDQHLAGALWFMDHHPQVIMHYLCRRGIFRQWGSNGTVIEEDHVRDRIDELSPLTEEERRIRTEIERATYRITPGPCNSDHLRRTRAMLMARLSLGRGSFTAQMIEERIPDLDAAVKANLPEPIQWVIATALLEWHRVPEHECHYDALTLRAVREQTEWLRAQGCVDESPPAELDWLGGPTVGIDGKLGTS